MKNTSIQWADHTFNPWIGCTRVSAGCANCYAAVARPSRALHVEWGRGQPRHRTSEQTWRQPLAWNAEAERAGTRPRVFCASLADVFDPEVPIGWLADLMDLIMETPRLTWMLLTKRPEHAAPRLYKATFHRWGPLGADLADLPNVWLGASIENQDAADTRLPVLLSTPARIHFASVEPMLGPVDLEPYVEWDDSDEYKIKRGAGLDWVIFGGESIGGRCCDPNWIRDGLTQCRNAGIAAFVKQLGSHASLRLRDPKGGDLNEWPGVLRVREFPMQL